MKELRAVENNVENFKELETIERFYNIYKNDDVIIIEADKSDMDEIVKRLSIINNTDFYAYFFKEKDIVQRDETEVLEVITMLGSRLTDIENLGDRDSIGQATFLINNSKFKTLHGSSLEAVNIKSEDDIKELLRIISEEH